MNTLGVIIGKALAGKTTIQREEIAGRLGISRRTLDNVVKGTSDLSLEQITKLSDVLGTDLFGQYFAKTGRKDLLVLQETANGESGMKKPELTLTFQIKSAPENFGSFQVFLNDLGRLTDKYGYELL